MTPCSTLATAPHASAASWGSIDLQSRTLRTLFGTWPTGVAIVTTRTHDGRPIGLTINSFTSLSLDPPLVLWSLGLHSSNLEAFRDCPHFAIHVLEMRDAALARHFASSKVKDRFAGIETGETPEGVPVIAAALTTLVCAHEDSRIAGDHLLLIGRVVRAADRPGTPLVFHAGRFTTLSHCDACGSPEP